MAFHDRERSSKIGSNNSNPQSTGSNTSNASKRNYITKHIPRGPRKRPSNNSNISNSNEHTSTDYNDSLSNNPLAKRLKPAHTHQNNSINNADNRYKEKSSSRTNSRYRGANDQSNNTSNSTNSNDRYLNSNSRRRNSHRRSQNSNSGPNSGNNTRSSSRYQGQINNSNSRYNTSNQHDDTNNKNDSNYSITNVTENEELISRKNMSNSASRYGKKGRNIRYSNTSGSTTNQKGIITNSRNSNDRSTNGSTYNDIKLRLPKGPKSFTSTTDISTTSSNLPNSNKNTNLHIDINSNNANNNIISQISKHIKFSILKQKRSSSVYERLLQVGEGTYGKVYKAKNRINWRNCCIEKLRLEGEKEGFPITSIREVKLLQTFNHENISKLTEIMCESQRIIYMIFEYSDNDLSGILLDKKLTIKPNQCKHLFKQLLLGIDYLHDNFILHRDIKGSNILVNNKGILKITDFGLARKMKLNYNINNDDNSNKNNMQYSEPPPENDYTNRVITLWYRPPELLMGTTNYSSEVDMWGCGCLLVELFNKTAIFQGINEIEQINSIFKILGTPNLNTWPEFHKMPWFFMILPFLKQNYEFKYFEKFRKLLPTEECYNLSLGLLDYNPKKRLNAKEALNSQYFKEDPLPEPLVLEGYVGRHEYEVKQARKLQKKKESGSGLGSHNTNNNTGNNNNNNSSHNPSVINHTNSNSNSNSNTHSSRSRSTSISADASLNTKK
ncbi:hypothetical protein TBLA_0H00370 [Henningerozyma blattae CBS 6284]|uniref:[RNA-polymerase]-subunit kinase n=1 Tax=Henningerozyma blattae (strain ATCC 34711 / CBS 6284 / DSM 70876 / NBRC 10599 / NRRL Y-10934 / UCD 77-7) TaxID=1071380 RepID=I2H7H8_HENB6|nr:hypothetical protein TBLA_0H00370 [Tetrapisispora blattae CBS 6284]CCH62330.1 hypothetical protein TBLA_0H00370 [Tetrapisispora blattae CBS 6284]